MAHKACNSMRIYFSVSFTDWCVEWSLFFQVFFICNSVFMLTPLNAHQQWPSCLIVMSGLWLSGKMLDCANSRSLTLNKNLKGRERREGEKKTEGWREEKGRRRREE